MSPDDATCDRLLTADTRLMASQWHYQLFGEEFGPVSEDVIRNLLAKGTLASDDSVRRDGSPWVAAGQALDATVAANGSASATAVLSTNAEEADDTEDWYCQVLGQELGPLSFNDLLRFAESGELSADDQVRFGAEGKWRRVGSMGRLVAVLPYQAAPLPSRPKPKIANAPANGVAKPAVAATVPLAPAPAAGTASISDLPEATELNWFAWIGGVEYGPSSLLQLKQWLTTGQLSASDMVKLGRTGAWCPSSTVTEILAALTAHTVNPVAAVSTPKPVTPSSPSKGSNPSVASIAASAPAKPAAASEVKATTPAVPAKVEPEPVVTPAPKVAPPPLSPANGSSGCGGNSSYSGGSTSSWQTPTPKIPPKPIAKPRASSSGGSSFDFSSITSMLDAKTLGMGGGAIAAVALVFAFMYMPAGNGLEANAFKELHPLFVEFQKIREKKGSDAEVQALSSKVEKVCPPLAAALEKRASVSRPASQKLFWVSKYRMKEMLSKGVATRTSAEIECERMLYEVSQVLKLPMDAPKPVETVEPKNKAKVLDVGT